MKAHRNASSPPAAHWTCPQVGLIFFALTACIAATQSRIALVVWTYDGVVAAVILTVATLAGAALLPLFRLGPLPARWRWLLSAGLGVGFLSLLTLACGVCGWIGPHRRLVAPLILAVVALVGLIVQQQAKPTGETRETAGGGRWLILVVAPFASLTLLVATLPPGVLWAEEGFGYDVLEYHLQTPREYYDNGAITYLPHNVYANFPAAAEMLYLFGMNTVGETIEAWSVAKCLNALLAVLAVGAAWLAGRTFSPRAGVVSAVLLASAGWLVYLSGVAYVENGMLFVGMLCAAGVLRAVRESDPSRRTRWVLLAGVLAGLSCGFKYTAIVLIALPIGIALLILLAPPLRSRIKLGGCFGLAALLAFAPWMIKNVVMTGNPVFPLLGQVFTVYPEGWGAVEASHFAEAHTPAPEEATLAARLGLLWKHIPGDRAQRFGPLVLLLAGVGVLRRRDRTTVALVAILGVQLGVWLFATHLYARFAVPMLIPLVLLAARGAVNRSDRLGKLVVFGIVLGVLFNLYMSAGLYVSEHIPIEGKTSVFTRGMIGPSRFLRTINTELPSDARVLFVGEARMFYVQRAADYCVVFNHNAFAEVADDSLRIEDILAWLRHHGYTHVLVNWQEVARLRASRYGFPEAITTQLFEQLVEVGLREREVFAYGDPPQPYAVLYEVP